MTTPGTFVACKVASNLPNQNRPRLEMDAALSSRTPRGSLRTLSTGLLAHSYLGQYEEALEWGTKARRIADAVGEPLLHARLEFNLGHVLAQRDRWREALERFRSALDFFHEGGEATDIAQAIRNIAVCHQQLNESATAVEVYREALSRKGRTSGR